MKHKITTNNTNDLYQWFLDNPMDYLEMKDALFDDDNFTIIGAIQSIDTDDVWEYSDWMTQEYIEDEKDNLKNAVCENPIVCYCRETDDRELIEGRTVADVICYCQKEFEGDKWTLWDFDGHLYAECCGRTYDFLMLTDEGVTMWYDEDYDYTYHCVMSHSKDIGFKCQEVYGYSY